MKLMDYEEFYEVIREQLPTAAAATSYNVAFYDITEHLHTNHIAFFTPTEQSNKRACRVYIANMHAHYIDHNSIDKAIKIILDEVKIATADSDPISRASADLTCGLIKGITKEYVLNNTVVSLRSKKDEGEYGGKYNVCRDYLDMYIAYDIRLNADKPEEELTLRLSKELADKYGITDSDFYDKAIANSVRLRPAVVDSQASLISEAEGIPDNIRTPLIQQALNNNKYSISNSFGYEGAAVILYPNILKKVAGIMNGNFYLLPVSRTEFYAAPADGRCNEGDLRTSVIVSENREKRYLNTLSRSLYLYDTDNENIKII